MSQYQKEAKLIQEEILREIENDNEDNIFEEIVPVESNLNPIVEKISNPVVTPELQKKVVESQKLVTEIANIVPKENVKKKIKYVGGEKREIIEEFIGGKPKGGWVGDMESDGDDYE